MKSIHTLLLLAYFTTHIPLQGDMVLENKKALVIVPIADLVGDPLYDANKRIPAEQLYKDIPYSATPNDGCKRLHQLLYNETVTVLDEKNDEVLVDITSAFYLIRSNRGRLTRYWTLKKNIRLYSEFKSQNDLERIPMPVDCTNPDSVKPAPLIVTLKKPWTDPTSKRTFSVGTRFIKDTSQKEIPQAIPVFLYDSYTTNFYTSNIPRNLLMPEPPADQTARIAMCVNLMREWINESGFIPYVLGGCSYTMRYNNDAITKTTQKMSDGTLATLYTRKPTEYPASGCDCSGLILRAAQMCNIPYFIKNSLTAAYTLADIKQGEKLAVGDLIYIPGHIMVVADLVKNTVIEARSYDHGYGRIQEIALNKVFKNINTFADLELIYFGYNYPNNTDTKSRPIILERFKDGDKVEAIDLSRYKLLNMQNVFDFYRGHLIYYDVNVSPLTSSTPNTEEYR